MVCQCILCLHSYILVRVNPGEPVNILSDFPEDYRGGRNMLKFSRTQTTQKLPQVSDFVASCMDVTYNFRVLFRRFSQDC